MNKRTKLLNLLQVLKPDQTSVDFDALDAEVDRLKKALKEKVQAQTIEDVQIQLEKFKKKLDFKSLFEAMGNLESTLDQKIKGISGLLNNEVSALKKALASRDQATNGQISTIASNIEALRTELSSLNEQKNVDVKGLKEKLDKLFDYSIEAQGSFLQIQKDIVATNKSAKDLVEKEVKEFNETIEKVRRELNTRINNIGGGSMNRQIFVGGNDPLTKYTDINLKAGSNVTITYTNNNTTRKADITISSTGGGPGGTTRSINSISTDQTAGDTSGTDYVYLVSGTTTITLPTAVANTNLYTIKNVGVGTVTINTTSSETIDGNLTIVMPVQFTSVDLISDTANWNIT